MAILTILLGFNSTTPLAWNLLASFLLLLWLNTVVDGHSFRRTPPTRVSGYASHTSSSEKTRSNEGALNSPRARLRIIEAEDVIQVECFNDPQNRTGVLISSRPDGSITIDMMMPNSSTEPLRGLLVEGLYGVYSIPSGKLWVWIVKSDVCYEAPLVHNQSWWQIRKVTRLHVTRQEVRTERTTTTPTSSPKISRAQRLEELRQISLLRQALKHHDWYICGGGPVPDMTLNLQNALSTNSFARNETNYVSTNSPLKPYSRFFWNEALVDVLAQEQEHSEASRLLLEHFLPVTSAFCGSQINLPIHHNNHTARYDQLLITRRSRFRAGTRFTKRGADRTGAVANYAETEQILFIHDNNRQLQSLCSHVQTRGSIPLRWSSPTDIKTYRPRVRIGTDPMAQARALRHHLADLASRYILLPPEQGGVGTAIRKHPSLVFVNLVDKKSDQGRLGRAFDSVLQAVLEVYANSTTVDHGNISDSLPFLLRMLTNSTVQHIWYDFHAEVKHGRWERLSQLLCKVKGSLMEHGYFRAVPRSRLENDTGDVSFQIERFQSGIVRTNCMDCLDRTNVVQGLFGRFVLFRQLSDTNLMSLPLKTAFGTNPMVLPWHEGENAHRLVWADNADAISRLYAGTPALKGDFTRTGKRTKKGALDDGMNSLQRYYLNNFQDADRQEGVDLLVGFQAFSGLASDQNDSTGAGSYSPNGNVNLRGMSIREAAHRALLGDYVAYDGDDRDHILIKRIRPRRGKVGVHHAAPLDLRWLPGDLQAQVRSVFSPATTARLPSQMILHALDKRAASDMPWWVTSDSSSSESENTREQHQFVVEAEAAALNNAGYLVGAFIAGTQAPLGMATFVLALLVASLPTESSGQG